MNFSVILSTILLTVSSVSAHMTLEVPASRDLKANNNGPAKTPCGTFAKGPVVATYNAGENVPVKIKGGAAHNGGGCVFSLSYDDGKSFKVIHVTDESCPIKTDFSVPIPKDAPSCESCIFAWSWVPTSSGQPEHYFQCADISIKGSGSGTLKGMELPTYNLEGGKKHFNDDNGSKTSPWVKLPEFANYQSGIGAGAGEKGPEKQPSPSTPAATPSSSPAASPSTPATSPSSSPSASPYPAATTGSAPKPTVVKKCKNKSTPVY